MLNNFQLAVIIRQGSQMHLRRVPLNQATQNSLAKSWHTQYEEFTREVSEIDFNPGYKPDAHEHFCVHDYELPGWLEREDSQTIQDIKKIGKDQARIGSIEGVVVFARGVRHEELVLFQNFTPSQMIQPGRTLLLEKDTYRSTEQPGLMLGGRLSAVYLQANRKLLFHNFRSVNTFLPLDDYYEEASAEEIREVLDHNLLSPENVEESVSSANQWSRKRFAMLRVSGVLDQFSAEEIYSRSEGYDVQVHISDDKIIFPVNKSAARKLLQFLNEERFRGAITDKLYETNSKREAE